MKIKIESLPYSRVETYEGEIDTGEKMYPFSIEYGIIGENYDMKIIWEGNLPINFVELEESIEEEFLGMIGKI